MTPSKKYTNLLKDTLIFTLGNVGSKVIVFFLVPFYTYYLTPEEYGISDLVFTISQLAIPFFSLVIFDAVIRFALYRKERPQDTLLVGVIVWFLGSVLAFAAAPLIGLYRPMSDWKWYIVAYMSINMLVSIEMNYLKGTADGDYGAKTVQAVKDFQLVNHLPIDGVAGPDTIRLMFRYPTYNSVVYKSKNGKVYHSRRDCSGMKNPTSMTLVEAMSQNLGPCSHCH